MQCLNIILLNTLVTLYKSGTPKFTMTSGAGRGWQEMELLHSSFTFQRLKL